MNKIYTLILLGLCPVITSCNSLFNTTSPAEVNIKGTPTVIRVYTGDAGLVNFSKRYPGKIIENEINGVQQIPIELFSADSIVYRVKGNKEKPLYVYSNGSKFEVFRDDKKDIVYTSTFIRVPVSEISYIELKKENKSKPILTGLVIGLSSLTVYIISNMSIQAVDTF